MPLLTTRAALSSSGFNSVAKRLAVDILVVGGGGGGKSPNGNDTVGGGGGGGQVVNLVYSLTRGSYLAGVGSGGSSLGGPNNGNESSFNSISAGIGYARAFGGVRAADTPVSFTNGGNGGSGTLGAAGIASGTNYAGGGGGGISNGFSGAFFTGTFGFGWYGGTPGPGYVWIDGNRYGQGGGGGALRNSDDVYGGGIGGAGEPRGASIARSSGLAVPAVAPVGRAGFGGTGGAQFSSTTLNGTDGADGCVIVSYAGSSAVASGGTIVIAGGRVYHQFTTPGNFTFSY
jgi:hypothetical protein